MLVSLHWLKNYVDIGTISPETLGEKITQAGIEVDGIHYVVSEKSENVVVGYVKECEKHPNADKLKLCQVDVGTETLQIICGAPNVRKGQKVVVAKPGAILPGNVEIKKVKLRGIESNGMICSLKELGVKEEYVLPEYVDGIVVLPDDAKVGEPVDELLQLDDAVLEFDLTPNRADALSMVGVAYDVAAILDKEITLPKIDVETIGEAATDYITVSVEDEKLCSYYGAFIVKDVEIKPSPLWMQNYLLKAGIRPINNVVDITNYVLMEYGQPLHAFDYDRLDSKEILVRTARDGEEIVTLDDQKRVLSSKHLLITDGEKGIALAGVMGGANTEVHDGTKTVLIEAAYFDPQTIRNAVNDTGLRSEASTRFEKGVDPNRVRESGLRACELLVKYANGKLVDGIAEFDRLDRNEKTIEVNLHEVNRRLGTEISSTEMEDIFRKLRFSYNKVSENYVVSIPTRRGDVNIFEDMLEEIARIYGYDNIPSTLPLNVASPGGLTEKQKLKRNVKVFLEGAGLSEAITYSLVDEKQVRELISPDVPKTVKPIALSMPLSEDHKYLRVSLLPELLRRLSYNAARKQNSVALYEIGSIFLTEEEKLTQQPIEQTRLAGAFTGTWVRHPWQQDVKIVDFFVVKGILEGLFSYLHVEALYKPVQLDDMHPGRCATIEVDGEIIGFLGQVHPNLAKELDLKETYVFDLNVERLLEKVEREYTYEPIPKFPSIARDIAFVVEKYVPAGDIKVEIERLGAPLVRQVEAFDVYTGEQIKESEKSLAFNVHFQALDKTLTDEEVDSLFSEIIEAIKTKFSATIRE